MMSPNPSGDDFTEPNDEYAYGLNKKRICNFPENETDEVNRFDGGR